MPSHFALQHATQAPSQVRIVWRIVWNSLVPSPSPHVREENVSGEGSGHETKSGNAWKAVWEWDQTPSAVGVHSRLVLRVLTVLIPLLICYLLIHRRHNSVFANITAIGMADCPAYGRTTQHQHQEDDYEYLSLHPSASHQDEGHSLNDSQRDAYENWFLLLLLNLKYLSCIMITKRMIMSLLPTLYVYYNMNYCLVCF